jgi:hypothetical protein
MKEVNRNISKVLELSRKLLFCADRGDIQREDDSCGVLYGIVRDCAYKIIDAAEKEKERHIQQGVWDESTEVDTNS